MAGRVAMGAPVTYRALPEGAANDTERIVECSLSPLGHIYAVLTHVRVQFWSALQTMVLLASVGLPKCSAVAGGDAAHKVAWHPLGRALAVATLDRRVIFLEADVHLQNDQVVRVGTDALELADVPSRVCVGLEVQLEFGLIVGLAAASQALLVCTSGGFVVGVGWNRGRVLFTWSSSHLLQRACAAPSAPPPSVPQPNGTVPGPPAHGPPDDGLTPNASPSTASAQQHHRVVFGGSIVSFSHVASYCLSCFVLADGTFGLLRTSPASLEAPPPPLPNEAEGAAHGACHAGYNAQHVALNPMYGVLAVSSAPNSDCILRLFAFDVVSLQLREEGSESGSASGGGGGGGGSTAVCSSLVHVSWCDDAKALGGVRCMQWTLGGSMLCVGFKKKGVAVFHYSGACLMTSFSRFEGSAPRRGMPSLYRGGCISASWDANGHRLVCAGHDTQQLVVVPFSIVASNQQGTSDASLGGASATVFGPTNVSWLQLDASDDAGEPTAWDTVECPSEYVADNYPIKHCTVSCDGQHVVCAGAYGAIVFSKRLRRWRMFSVKSQERQFTCVCEPCWLSDVIVALPVRHHPTKAFEVQFYPRFHLNDASLLQRIRCERRPTMACAGPRGFHRAAESVFLVLESTNLLRVFAVEVMADSVLAPRHVGMNLQPVRTIELRDGFDAPHFLALCPAPRRMFLRRSKRPVGGGATGGPVDPQQQQQPSPASAAVQPWLLLITRRHCLVCVSLSDRGTYLSSNPPCASPVIHGDAASSAVSCCPYVYISHPGERIYRAWCDLTYHPMFPSSGLVVVHNDRGMILCWLDSAPPSSSQSGTAAVPTQGANHPSSSSGSGTLPTCTWRSQITSNDDDGSIPLAVLPHDGVVVLASEGLDAQPFRDAPPRFRCTVKPVLYAHRALYPAIVAMVERHDDDEAVGSPRTHHGDTAATAAAQHTRDPTGSTVPVDEDGVAYCTEILQRLRDQGAFIGTMDYLLHLILHDDDAHQHGRVKHVAVSSSASDGHLEGSSSSIASPSPHQHSTREQRRRAVLYAAIHLLKSFSEYHTVMVGLVRKVDMSKWRAIFDVIGAPIDFFEDCLASGHLVEAAHVVRVVMMDVVTQHTVVHDDLCGAVGDANTVDIIGSSPGARRGGGNAAAAHAQRRRVLTPLEAAARCALRLFPIVLQQLDVPLTCELFRFLSMLLVELTGGACIADTTSSKGAVVAGGGVLHSNAAACEDSPQGRGSGRALELWRSIWSSPPSSATTGGANGEKHTGASSSSMWQHVHLNLLFRSPHQQDNLAARALMLRFPSLCSDVEQTLVRDLFLELRLHAFQRFCRGMAIDVPVCVRSMPWRLIALQWTARSALRHDVASTKVAVTAEDPSTDKHPQTELQQHHLKAYLLMQLQRDARWWGQLDLGGDGIEDTPPLMLRPDHVDPGSARTTHTSGSARSLIAVLQAVAESLQADDPTAAMAAQTLADCMPLVFD